ncbi:MAG TPA: polyprenyl synthetase family protein [Solirubrobacterales bacterium]
MSEVLTSSVEADLARYGAMTRDALSLYVPDMEPRRHLWDLVAEYPGRGGKAIRPALCLATAVAFGGEVDEALPSAAALELLHNAFLVHDDIEDASLLRRGRPTLHAEHGVPLAINAGDALVVLAGSALRDNRRRLGSRLASRIGDEFDLMARRTIEGQARELGWRRDGVCDLEPDDYLDLIMHKTCWYTTIHPLRVGALIGSLGRVDLDPLVRFGFYLGAAFQIRDDLLNVVGDEAKYGKESCGDLYEGKRTLMIIHLLRQARDDDRRAVERFLAMERPQRTPGDVAEMVELMRHYGSLDFTRAFGLGIAEAATDAFEVAFAAVSDSPERRFLHDLIAWMLERDA